MNKILTPTREEIIEFLKSDEAKKANIEIDDGLSYLDKEVLVRAALKYFGVQQEPVGVVGKMPGTDGFTMVVFNAEDVPIGTKLYKMRQ